MSDDADRDRERFPDEARLEHPSAEARARALEATLAAIDEEEDELASPAIRTSQRDSLLDSMQVEPRRERVVALRWRSVGSIAIAAAAGFALWIGGSTLRDRRGDVTATARSEITIGSRARAVLEPSAHVAWSSPSDVTQSAGEVFYRVEPGEAFVVHTTAGDVTVLGTCFRVKLLSSSSSSGAPADMNLRDMKSGAIGALASASALVIVYEGKVAVSHAGQSLELKAGEAANVGAGGPRRTTEGTPESKSSALTTTDEEASADPTAAANKNLVLSVSDYRARLERMVVQQKALEQQLADARAKLDATDAGLAPPKNEITDDEWKDLAKNGSVKMRVPCNWKGGWHPSAKQLGEMGLAPQDASTIREASSRLHESSWARIKPVCEKVGGKDIAEKLGLDGCPSFVFNYLRGVDRDSAWEQMRRVSEMRAGLRPTLSLDDPSLGPIETVFLVMTGQQRAMEQDLAQSFGPDEAHRIVTSEGFCAWSSTWNGTGPRRP